MAIVTSEVEGFDTLTGMHRTVSTYQLEPSILLSY
ncbi:Uncharacterised protein [Yersinia pseudotuberculosis]|nr:Uncharacterised protein [Yersinia pseudotuberculosis]CQH49469.1 Uncharacterised protein [Yersinia pseudotuberculosis]